MKPSEMKDMDPKDAQLHYPQPGISARAGQAVTALAGLLGLQPWAVFQLLIPVVGSAVGNAIKVRTPILSTPLNLAFHCLLCVERLSPMTNALDFLLQPFRDFQDQRAKLLSKRGRELLEKEVAKLEAFEARARAQEALEEDATIIPKTNISLLCRPLHPFVVLDDPRPNQLARLLPSSLDSASAVVYSDTALEGLLNAGPDAADDWILLHSSLTGRSHHAPCLDKKPGSAVVRPALAAFLVAHQTTAGRLFASPDPLIRQFAAQPVYIESTEGDLQSSTHGAPEEPVQWLTSFMAELLGLREEGSEVVMTLTPGASRLLVEFSHQQWKAARDPSCRQAPHLCGGTPYIAAKVAGAFEVLSGQMAKEISEEVMAKAINLVGAWNQGTRKLAEFLMRQNHDRELSNRAEKMATFLSETGPVRKWELFRRFDVHRKELMEPALDLLVRTNRAHLVNGCVELTEG